MSAEQRAQGGRGWVHIPASRTEQPAPAARTAGARSTAARTAPPYAPPGYGAPDQPTIYLSLVRRWQEAGRTLPGHPDEEWERLISQPCWPGR
ncbi:MULTISPECIES: hypothetical protein [unclassified Streptomyces]|uniref:hypothetical protein n=1 Tax=unclassified Streptomyces TaxID=2593676 RepID=UPI002E2978CD|nr:MULTISPECIES: hypothetical protein [unclassified Streptomyces]